ncbi:MAG: DsbA family protein [Pseudomonadota bacterium]
MSIRSVLFSALMALGLVVALPMGAQAFDVENMNEAEREAFGEAVRGYIMENPEIIRDAIEALQARQEEAERGRESARVRQYIAALYDTSYSWVGGNPDGDVTMVEFLDYRCAFCKRAHPIVKEVIESDPNVRLIVREYPILGPDSVTAGRMAMAAYRIDPSMYPQLSDELMAFQGELTETMAYRIADQLGYDVSELKALANSAEIEAEIEKTYRLADALGVRGTPTFIIGDRIVRGALPADQLLAEIETAREATN